MRFNYTVEEISEDYREETAIMANSICGFEIDTAEVFV